MRAAQLQPSGLCPPAGGTRLLYCSRSSVRARVSFSRTNVACTSRRIPLLQQRKQCRTCPWWPYNATAAATVGEQSTLYVHGGQSNGENQPKHKRRLRPVRPGRPRKRATRPHVHGLTTRAARGTKEAKAPSRPPSRLLRQCRRIPQRPGAHLFSRRSSTTASPVSLKKRSRVGHVNT